MQFPTEHFWENIPWEHIFDLDYWHPHYFPPPPPDRPGEIIIIPGWEPGGKPWPAPKPSLPLPDDVPYPFDRPDVEDYWGDDTHPDPDDPPPIDPFGPGPHDDPDPPEPEPDPDPWDRGQGKYEMAAKLAQLAPSISSVFPRVYEETGYATVSHDGAPIPHLDKPRALVPWYDSSHNLWIVPVIHRMQIEPPVSVLDYFNDPGTKVYLTWGLVYFPIDTPIQDAMVNPMFFMRDWMFSYNVGAVEKPTTISSSLFDTRLEKPKIVDGDLFVFVDFDYADIGAVDVNFAYKIYYSRIVLSPMQWMRIKNTRIPSG